MRNLFIFSIESGTGKTTFIISLLKILKNNKLNYKPQKPISVTTDVQIVKEKVIPWSIYAQLKQCKCEYETSMNPILLIPIDKNCDDIIYGESRYKMYFKGKYLTEITGREFQEEREYYENIIMQECIKLNTPVCLEGTGNVLSTDFQIDLKLVVTGNFVNILVVDGGKAFNDIKYKKIIYEIRRYRVKIDGVVITKYGKCDHISEIVKFFEAHNIDILGLIPMYSKMIDSSESIFDEWSNYVLQRLNLFLLKEKLNL